MEDWYLMWVGISLIAAGVICIGWMLIVLGGKPRGKTALGEVVATVAKVQNPLPEKRGYVQGPLRVGQKTQWDHGSRH